ncbi:MAG: ribonucleotide reductase N-terminal alpha domain-containing protein, partial [Chloroflexota bacterium]|nr:ribonucleotide reductase N-terminal alpha domain-containing protein [Chloroflexota bacterium]
MTQEIVSDGSDASEDRNGVISEVVKALENAGVAGDVTAAVTSNLMKGGIEIIEEELGDGLSLSDNARFIIEKRYLRKGDDGEPIEDPEGLFRRVSNAIALGEPESKQAEYEEKYYEKMSTLKFLPNSPTIVNAGTGRGCLSACFVVSPDDNIQSIMQVANDAAMIEKWGGGIGFGLSSLRPKKDKISTTHGQACGPIAVMKLYSSVGATLTQGAFRLGAHMGQLIVSHPDIEEFIHCKDDDDSLQNFNISVQITDEFMNAVENDEEFALV